MPRSGFASILNSRSLTFLILWLPLLLTRSLNTTELACAVIISLSCTAQTGQSILSVPALRSAPPARPAALSGLGGSCHLRLSQEDRSSTSCRCHTLRCFG